MTETWSPRVTRVLAPNPSPLTLEGTNTFVVADPGAAAVVVIDPGPEDEGHAQAVVGACAGREVELVLLTHTHVDHAEGARAFAGRVGAPLAAMAEGWSTAGAPDLAAGSPLAAGGLELRLDRRPERLYPGHGPLVSDAVARVEGYLAHRRDREAQVLAALVAGDRTPAEVVARVYAEVDPALHPAAELSVRAHLVKLVREGRVATGDGERFTPARPRRPTRRRGRAGTSPRRTRPPGGGE